MDLCRRHPDPQDLHIRRQYRLLELRPPVHRKARLLRDLTNLLPVLMPRWQGPMLHHLMGGAVNIPDLHQSSRQGERI